MTTVREVIGGNGDVETEAEKAGEITEIYDAVFVCSGMYKQPNTPDYPGLDDFQGIKVHTNEYRRADPYRGKTVMVMGKSCTRRLERHTFCVLLSHKQIFEYCSYRKYIMLSNTVFKFFPDNIDEKYVINGSPKLFDH